MTPIPFPARRGGRLLAVAAAASVAMSAAPTASAAGAPPAQADSTHVSAPGDSAAGRTHSVTLLTGDVAVLHVAPDGRQAGWLEGPASPDSPPPHIYEQDGEVHVVPAEAHPYVASGVLDDRLFNVSGLVEQGYDDRSRDDLPLVLGTPDGGADDVPETPAGSRRARVLSSIGAVSVEADKSRMRSVWESLRGPEPAELTDDDAQLAGGGQVWLNGQVEATLGDSVGAVGAPAAWDTGFDGSGVRVAVLDSGADPHHPDLVGQIGDARNFTDEEDPAGETAVDGHGHGTHVAATVAGTGAGAGAEAAGAGPGVAPGADLLVGKVLNSGGSGLEAWVIDGMEWAVEQGADVVNMSLGSPWASDGTDPLSQAVNDLTEESGALFVVAAGNNGPGEQTVGSPGAATRALTVGATTVDDEQAAFSSRGPRLNDLAIKPEIVAPGVGIVAARGAGTSLGNLVSDRYTSLNGTSMATPHVAGAAAIAAQQHPDLDAAELKARLVATSNALDEPVNFQGSGRLDAAAAVTSDLVVSKGALSLGRVEDNSGPARRTLTYENTSERTMTLHLSSEVTSTGVRDKRRPALRVRPSALVIPPGGAANAEVELRTGPTKPGTYSGHIVAQDRRNPATRGHTALSATVEGEKHTVTVTGVDRHGEPASGSVDLWSAETGDLTRVFMDEGIAVAEVPEGLYAMSLTLTDAGPYFETDSYTIGGEPELTVRRDLARHYDAREADPVEVVTPREADMDSFNVQWYREVGDRSVTVLAAQGIFGQTVHLLESKRARTGSFELSASWREVQPLLTARLGGPDGEALRPSPALASSGTQYVGEDTLPVAYVGTGTPEEFDEVDVAGKIALATRAEGFDTVRQQAEAAHAAGAAALLVHNDEGGAWVQRHHDSELPAYTIGRAAGEAIRDGLAADAGFSLALSGIGEATYNYQIAFAEAEAIPAGVTYDVAQRPTAVVESEFRQDSEQLSGRERWVPYVGSFGIGPASSLSRGGPVARTEYVSTEDVSWQLFAQPHPEFLNVYWVQSPIMQFEAGESRRQVWWGPLTRPGVPNLPGAEQAGMPAGRFHDAIRIAIPQYSFAGSTIYTFADTRLGDSTTLTLRRDGELVGTAPSSEAQFSVPRAESGYELELVVADGDGNFKGTSTATESTWSFRSGRPLGGHEVLPLVQLDYHLAAGLYNEMPTGESYELEIDPGYQPGVSGPGGFTGTVEVSFDDRETWVEAPVAAGNGVLAATVPAAGPDAEFASVRVVATDSDGNSLTQVIERAWRLGEGLAD